MHRIDQETLKPTVAHILTASNEFEGVHGKQAHVDAYAAFEFLMDTRADGRVLGEEEVLEAHRILMEHQPIEVGEQGIYRSRASWVGDRLMPPAPKVPALTRLVIAEVGIVRPYVVADALVKIHPFVDGNGRLARLVHTVLEVEQGHKLVAMTGLHGMSERARLVDWLAKNYPKCDNEGIPVDPEHAARTDWEGIMRKLIRKNGTR